MRPLKMWSMCCFFTKHLTLRRTSKDWLAGNQDNVSGVTCLSLDYCFSKIALMFSFWEILEQRVFRMEESIFEHLRKSGTSCLGYCEQMTPLTKKSKWGLWQSEWLLFNANSAIFQLYHGENKLIFNEMMMRSTLMCLGLTLGWTYPWIEAGLLKIFKCTSTSLFTGGTFY
jgi:hypothetical protein